MKINDVRWMMKHSLRHWLQIASAFEVTDYQADRMRQVRKTCQLAPCCLLLAARFKWLA